MLVLLSCAPAKQVAKQEKPSPPPRVEKPSPPPPPKPSPSKPAAAKPSSPSPPKRKQVRAKPKPTEGKDKYIVLNFDNADLEVVLQTISELVGLNYILGPKVKGKITIQTYKKIPRSDLLSVLHSILDVNGFTTVQSGHYVKIIPTSTAKQHPIETRIGKDETQISPEDIAITQIIPLEYIAVDELASIIKPLVSKEGTLITHKSTNMMILNDISSNIKRLMRIINMLDQPTQLEVGEKVFVYYVENGDAEKLASLLNKIYGKGPTKKEITRVITPPRSKRKAKASKKVVTEGISKGLEGEITIEAAPEINALIIKTTPRNYKVITELLKKLDIMPKQVLIEVLIADITLSDEFQFGLEWWVNNASRHIGGHRGTIPYTQTTSFLPAGAEGPAGTLSYLLEQGTQGELFHSLIAIQAAKGNVNILSSPHILTTDNQEASISIVNQVPIPKTTETETGTLITTYEYKDAGITLKVTPKINEKGLVTMQLSLEVTDVGEKKTFDTEQVPFLKRNAQTSVVVQDGQTLVLGGLISENQSESRTGIPFLMDIPVIGYLFGTTTKSLNKTELVMLITPHVVRSREDVDKLTEQFEKNVDKLRKGMGIKVD
jgi:general secretion pathway protein D